MTTNNTRDEMIARGRAGRGDASTPLITNRPRYSTFDLYAADGRYLGSFPAVSAQSASDEWERLHGELPLLIEELD